MPLNSVVLNNKTYSYEYGGCGEAVYVYDKIADSAPLYHASEALVIVPGNRHFTNEWKEIAEVALQSIDRDRERAVARLEQRAVG